MKKIYKIIIGGTRKFKDLERMVLCLNKYIRELKHRHKLSYDEELPDGAIIILASNAKDDPGQYFIDNHTHQYKVEIIPVDWDTHGKKAWSEYCMDVAHQGTDAIVFWDNRDTGAKQLLTACASAGIRTNIFRTQI